MLGGYCFPKEFMCLNNPELLSVPFFPSDIGNSVLNAVNTTNSTGYGYNNYSSNIFSNYNSSGAGSNIFANNNSNNNNTNIFARNNSTVGNGNSTNIFSNNNTTGGGGYASGGTNIFNNGNSNNNMGSSNIFNNNNSMGNSIFNRPQTQVGGGNIFSNNNSSYGTQQGGSIFSNQNGNSNNIFRGNNSGGSIFNNGGNNSNPNLYNQAPTYGPSNQNMGGQYNNGQYGPQGYMNSAYPGMHPQYYGGGMIPPYNPYMIPGAPAVIYVPIKERREDDSMSELYVDGKFATEERDSYHRNLENNRGSRLRNSLLAKDLAQGLPVTGLSNSRSMRSRSLYELQ